MHHRPSDDTYVWFMRTLIRTYPGDLEDALTAADRAGARAERLGNRHLLAVVTNDAARRSQRAARTTP